MIETIPWIVKLFDSSMKTSVPITDISLSNKSKDSHREDFDRPKTDNKIEDTEVNKCKVLPDNYKSSNIQEIINNEEIKIFQWGN